MGKSKKPVSSARYDQDWINSAWGSESADDLLNTQIVPKPRPRVARALELAQLEPGIACLDIACGRGEVPLFMAQVGAYAVGLDFSVDALAMANKAKAAHFASLPDKASLEFVHADATVLPFPDQSFDRVTMLDIIEHLTPEQLDAMLREVNRVLRPNGYAVIHTLPNRWVYDVGYRLLSKIIPGLSEDPRSDIEKQVHINEQDLFSLRDTLSRTGFSYRFWLEQKMVEQAKWQVANNRFYDNRDAIYPKLAGAAGWLLEVLSKTPFKLVLSNDFYGLLWKDERPSMKRLVPLSLTERFIIRHFR